MGKSPAKWIKAVLFGKKSSKSHLSKDVTGEKKSAAKAPLGDLALNSPTILDPPVQNIDTDIGGDQAGLEKGTGIDFACDTTSLSSATHDIDLHVKGAIPIDDAELERLENAATKAQAAFRGYLARRAFRALRGIIRLQALIRGHLVRRQAVATLHCMQAIVRMQALARGRRVRLLDSGDQLLRKFNFRELKDPDQVDSSVINLSIWPTKLTANAFPRKLLVAVPTAMPLSLQYNVSEPNSAWQWLERWSLSRFWEPLPQTKKVVAKLHKKQGNKQSVETEAVRPKRGVKKILTAANGDAVSSSEPEKVKRNPKKFSNHHVEPVQDQPQNELEKVKRNLRKVSAALATHSERSETETEKPQLTPNLAQAKTSKSSPPNVVEQIEVNSSEKTSDPASEIAKLAVNEAPLPVEVDEPSNVLHDHPTVEQRQLVDVANTANSPVVNEDLSSMEDHTTKERTRRRKSLPNKQENCENISQNAPNLPSYMAATASAKAKLKAQGSPKVNEDEAENGFVRRHSLPSSTSGKFNSLSPRIQRPVQANGKSGNRNRAVSSSKDGKVLQTGWKR